MSIGDIQLSKEAIETSEDADLSALARPHSVARRGVVIGEQPDDDHHEAEETLEDTALPRERVEAFLDELTYQPAWRREADRAADYYDGNQLSAETVELLKERGQPPLIANLIKPTVDTVLGMEAKTRTDWRVRPEDDEECDGDLAEALSLKLKQAETETRADRAISDAYSAMCKAGLGWVEVAREHDPFKCPYRVKYIHRREIFWDWRSEQPDLSDARYLIRRRWLELDHAIAMMPRYAALFRAATGAWAGFDPLIEDNTGLVHSYEVERDTRLSASDWRDTEQQRICLYEIWYRKWVRGYVMTLPNKTVLEVDFKNPRHCEAIASGIAQVKEATFQKVRLAWYAGPHFLYDVASPYKHGQFPYVPFFGYREDLTNAPYGLIRSMIAPQDEINARKSKMLWALNSRRVIADSDAVMDHSAAAREVARPDAYITLRAERKPNSQFRVESGGELASQQFQVMQEAKQEIAETSGIHKAMMGQNTSTTSGLAINSLVEQGLNTLAELNDNYRFARRLVGEMLFELVQQSLMHEQSRITLGEGRNKKLVVLNEEVVDEETGQMVKRNDVARVKAKVVLDDIPSTQTFRLQQLQMLSEITKSLPPNLQAGVIDFVIEATDIPNRHEMAERLRGLIGIADPEKQQAQQEQQQQAAQEEKEMQKKLFVLDAAEKAARVRKLNADADAKLALVPH